MTARTVASFAAGFAAGTGDLIARYRNPASGHRGVGYFDWNGLPASAKTLIGAAR